MQRMSVEQLRTQLPIFVSRIRNETNVPGIAVAVSIGGEQIHAHAGTRLARGSAPLTIDDPFALGCAMELLAAIVALEVALSGKLALDAPLIEYLPELTGTVHGETIRVEHLLSHTSGYRGTSILEPKARAFTWDSFIDYLRHAPQSFTPGAVFNYEHTEAVLLAQIVHRVTGKTTSALIREMILEPLRLAPGALGAAAADSAGWHEFDHRTGRFKRLQPTPPTPQFWLPAFSDSTLPLAGLLDVAASAIAPRGPAANGRACMSAASLALLQRPVVWLPEMAGGPLREALPVAFGLGTATLRDGFHGNSGLTHGQCLGLRFDSLAQIAVAAGLNAMAPQLRDFILAAICRDLTGGLPSTAARPPFEFDLRELPGVYRGPGESTVVAAFANERLTCDIGADGAGRKLRVELLLAGDSSLVVRSPLPQLSLGFFRESSRGDLGLMLGLNAYKRDSDR